MIYFAFALNVAALAMNLSFLYHGIGLRWVAVVSAALNVLGSVKTLPYVLHRLRS